jgi:hypothetical protein
MNNLINCLNTLITKTASGTSLSRQRASEKVLENIFNVRVEHIQCSIEEATTVGTQIKGLIKDLDKCVFRLGNQFDPNRGRYNLILRSGIQFLLDDLKSWPTDDGCLEKHLKIFVEGDSLETFDEALEEWKEDPPYLSFDSIIFTEKELRRPDGVPDSHTWWF